MKILLVTDLYPLNNENISKALLNFALSWKNQGNNVEVIRPNFLFNTFIRNRKIVKENIYEEFGIKIYNLNFISPFLFNVRRKLPDDFSLFNYDVIVSHMPSGALMAQRLLEKEKIKYVCSVHCSDIVVLKNFIYSFYFKNKLKKAYLQADKISARSYVLQEKIEKIIPQIREKTFVAYSGIDRNMKSNLKKINYKNLKICTVSSLIKRKNIDITIKALSSLNVNFEFTIIGDGKERKALEKLAKKMRIDKKINFTGKISNEEVFKILENSDIFILISSNETFGLAYLEAMNAGNIIIAKQFDGIDGILEDNKNSFLIQPKESELIKCIEKIINTKTEKIDKLRICAKETAAKLSMDVAAKHYLSGIELFSQ